MKDKPFPIAKAVAITMTVLLLYGCSLLKKAPPAAQPSTKVNNVILIIGDGMGPQQIGLLLSYARQAPHGVLKNRKTALDRLLENGRIGTSLTYPDGALVTDSAASATQLATGKFTKPEMVGLDANGRPAQNILEQAKRWGKATGLVSDTRITHATPASFAAHDIHRSHETTLSEGLLNANTDVMLSGGLDYWLPKAAADPDSTLHRQLATQAEHAFKIGSARKDNKNLLAAAQRQGYQLVFNARQLRQATGKTLGLFAGSDMSDGIAESKNRQDANHSEPTLAEMSEQALKILQRNTRGFFLMIEAGQIDWASHRNDTGLLLHEMLRFDAMLHKVLDWMGERDDTLLIVTADHETGGFGFNYSGNNIPAPQQLAGGGLFKPNLNFGNPEVLDRLYAQSLSYHDMLTEFDALPPSQKTPAGLSAWINRFTAFKISDIEAKSILETEAHAGVYTKDNRENVLSAIVSPKQQVVWASNTHTSTPVLVFSKGNRLATQPFATFLHHTDIGRLISDALQPEDVR